MSGFAVIRNKGFHIRFPNGVTLSTQFGGGNYCSNYDFPIGSESTQAAMESHDAEIAAWLPGGPKGRWITKDILVSSGVEGNPSDEVHGWVSMGDWLKLFDACREYEEEPSP